MSRQGYDRHITIFSPDGKLFQIEYALKAVTTCGITGVALKGENTCVVVTQKKATDPLMDKSYNTSLFKVTPNIGVMALGLVPDCRLCVAQARQVAASFMDKNGYEIPVHVLANKMGKKAQIFTQNAGVRPLASTMTYFVLFYRVFSFLFYKLVGRLILIS